MSKKIVIVGGVAGGASTAARLRRLDEDAEIILFERDEYISFANCGLPYYIGETITERNKLIVQTPEAMKSRFNLDIRINSEVTNINTNEKTVQVNSKIKGIYTESYDYLVLSPGAKALRPPIKGIDNSKIFTLRNIPDTDRIKDYLENNAVKRACVIGGGFVGVEMAENLIEKGLAVTLIEAAPHILAPFDSDMVTIAEKELQDNGVKLILGNSVTAFNDNGQGIVITLDNQMEIEVDMIILAIGVTPVTEFVKDSGIELGARGHVLVNEKLQTNIEGVYALGDAVEVVDFINGTQTTIPLAGPANKQGRIAANNICGLESNYKGTQGTSIIKIFSLTAAATGNNERTLSRLGIPYRVVIVHPNSHAGYYPDATPMAIKLMFSPEGKILGAQILGYDGVDKRIDDIATVIRLNGTVTDLTELELAYAPPYSSAKDPVNMVGYVAENVLVGKMEVVLAKDIKGIDTQNVFLLDVRTEEEFVNRSIKGAVNIPVDVLRDRLNELPKDKEIWVYCKVGLRGYIASRILCQKGFKVKNLTGGYQSYMQADFKPSQVLNELINTAKETTATQVVEEYDRALDACGLCCPGPLMQVKMCIDELRENQILKVSATDQGFYEDIKAWCKNTGNQLLSLYKTGHKITAHIKKGTEKDMKLNQSNSAAVKDNKTMVVFSGDLDKALASFIIANGAASMGKKVTMFFTFWGLNVLRKPEKVSVAKGLMDKMFGMMMPRGTKELKLSKMNMLGLGTQMLKMVMKNKNVSSLDELIVAAMENGVEIVACQMSMDIMGIKIEELIAGVKLGGVGYYLGEAEESNVNLFI